MAMASCVVQSQTAANGMKNWFFCVSSRCKSRARRRICAEAGWPSVSSDCRSLPEQGRFERLALQPIQQVGQENQVMPALVDGRPAPGGPGRPAPGANAPFERQHADQREAPRSRRTPSRSTAAEPEQGQQKGRDSQADAREDARGLAPLAPGPRDRSPERTSEPSSSRSSLRSSRGRSSSTAACRSRMVSGVAGDKQPCRQCLLAGARPRRAKPLEERALAEEVEVGGIRMIDVQEARPVDPGHRPSGHPAAPAPWHRTPSPGRLDGSAGGVGS